MLISIGINNMKKFYFILIFILTGIIFQFSSCNEKLYSVLIENNSSKPVSYKYNDNIEPDYLGITVGVDNFKQYTVGPYTRPPKDINVDGVMNIKMLNQNGQIYTFVDIEESETFTLYVNNTLPIEVVLRADKYIYFEYITNEDKIDEEPIIEILTEMKIPAYKLITGKIYTATPNFTLFPSQYTVDWNFNEEKTAIHVTIR
jgi:hypothetical protein